MPTLELAAGQVVTAAHTNTYWMRQVIATGLSSARPTGYQGRAVYDTDTHRLMIYASATTGWRAPWNLPWGHIDSCELSMTYSQNNTNVNLCSMNVPVVQGRRYKIYGQARCSPFPGLATNKGTLHWSPAFTTGSGLLASYRSTLLMGVGADFGTGQQTDLCPSFCNIYDAVGTGNVIVNGNAWTAGMAAQWSVGSWVDMEDIGPATSPP